MTDHQPATGNENAQQAIADLRQQLEEAEADNAAMRDWTIKWLRYLYTALVREGWEDGPTMDDASNAIHDLLGNLGIKRKGRLIRNHPGYMPPSGSSLLASHAEEIAAKDAEIRALKEALEKKEG
jgi:hypothetical protein